MAWTQKYGKPCPAQMFMQALNLLRKMRFVKGRDFCADHLYYFFSQTYENRLPRHDGNCLLDSQYRKHFAFSVHPVCTELPRLEQLINVPLFSSIKYIVSVLAFSVVSNPCRSFPKCQMNIMPDVGNSLCLRSIQFFLKTAEDKSSLLWKSFLTRLREGLLLLSFFYW